LADVGHHAPLEPADQPGLEARDLLGWSVRGQGDLLSTFIKGVEGVEELLLGRLFALQEMDVIHQKQIDVAPVALPALWHGPPSDPLDDFVDELLGAYVEHPGVGPGADHR